MNTIKCFLLIVSLLASNGCIPTSPAAQKPDIAGTVTSITVNKSDSNKVDAIFVESNASGSAYDKASIKITGDTVITQGSSKIAATTDYLNKDAVVEVQFTGEVLESYPVQATAKTIKLISSPVKNSPSAEKPEENPSSAVNAYMLVIDSLYKKDTGLNEGIEYLAVDTTQMKNLTADDKKQLLSALKKYNLTVLDTTLEKLQADGLVKDLYFEKGILFRIEDESLKNDTLTLKASKWRSGLGAIGTDKMVLKKTNDTWKITDEGSMWIS